MALIDVDLGAGKDENPELFADLAEDWPPRDRVVVGHGDHGDASILVSLNQGSGEGLIGFGAASIPEFVVLVGGRMDL